MIPAIETKYAGCRFRSRLEARWAVFFDALKIEWSYEPEGFETASGKYLPDFRLASVRRPVPMLPDNHGWSNDAAWAATPNDRPSTPMWVEIKGAAPSVRDVKRAVELAGNLWRTHGDRFILLQGDIPREAVVGYVWSADFEDFVRCSIWRYSSATIDALTTARSARFEHGEMPVVPTPAAVTQPLTAGSANSVDEWLENYLQYRGGSAPVDLLRNAARAEGYDERQLREARQRLGIDFNNDDSIWSSS